MSWLSYDNAPGNAAKQSVCYSDTDVDKDCMAPGKTVSSQVGFITSPSYPALTQFQTCTWTISVPENHYLHIFLHEVCTFSS